jgi:hypothetical protein
MKPDSGHEIKNQPRMAGRELSGMGFSTASLET